jgi:hypothetical protein
MIVMIIPNICFIVYLSPKINVLVKNNKNREVNLINNEFNNLQISKMLLDCLGEG